MGGIFWPFDSCCEEGWNDWNRSSDSGPDQSQKAKLYWLPFTKKKRSRRSQGHLNQKAILRIKGGPETGETDNDKINFCLF